MKSIDYLLKHIKEQTNKNQFWNAIEICNELMKALINEFNNILKNHYLINQSDKWDKRNSCIWYGGDCGNGEKCSDECYEPNDKYCDKCTWRNNPDECALSVGDKEPCPGHGEKTCKVCGLNPCICFEEGYDL